MTAPSQDAVDFLVSQIRDLRREVRALKAQQVGYVQAPVTAVDAAGSTFSVQPAGQVDGATSDLSGIASPPHFLPNVGDTVTLAQPGAQLIYQPQRVADEAIGRPQLDPSVTLSIDGKTTVTFSTSGASGSGVTAGDLWFQRDTSNIIIGSWRWDGTTWQQTAFGDEVLNSLTAGKILTGVLAAGVQITIGDPNSSHVLLTSTGTYYYQSTSDGVQLVGQQGTSGSDFLGLADSTGKLIFSVDDTGVITGTGLNITGDVYIHGTKLLDQLGGASGAGNGNPNIDRGAQHYYGYNYSFYTGVGSLDIPPGVEYGLIEQDVYVTAGRTYWICPEVSWHANGTLCELQLKVKDGGTSTPSISSPQIFLRYFHLPIVNWDGVAHTMGIWQPQTTGIHKLLLAAGNTPSANASLTVNNANCAPTINIIDAGPSKGINASANSGGGTAPAPVQQYYTEISPGGYWRYRGDGTYRSDTSDIVQGWDPSGYNGDGQGHWAFGLPTITGSVDRVDLYLQTNLTYYNSGGQAILNLADSWGVFNPHKLFGDWNPGITYPKTGGITVTLPSSWYSAFKGTGITRAITAGPSGGTNETFYCRFDGPSARLRVYYTQ